MGDTVFAQEDIELVSDDTGPMYKWSKWWGLCISGAKIFKTPNLHKWSKLAIHGAKTWSHQHQNCGWQLPCKEICLIWPLCKWHNRSHFCISGTKRSREWIFKLALARSGETSAIGGEVYYPWKYCPMLVNSTISFMLSKCMPPESATATGAVEGAGLHGSNYNRDI